MLAKAAYLATGFWECISVFSVMAANGFALTATHFGKACAARPKVSKGLCPSIRCLAKALLRGAAAIGHPWPGAATAASMPRCPLRNTCVWPLEMGQQITIKI